MPTFNGLQPGQWAAGLHGGAAQDRTFMDAVQRHQAMAPYGLAALTAANQARSAAETIAQRGGNPFAAARLGSQAAASAAAPIHAQGAAAEANIIAQQQARLRAEEE